MWPFGKKNKTKEEKEPNPKLLAKAKAIAAMRGATERLGEDTIKEMARALEAEKAKETIRDAIDGKSKHADRDDVLRQLKDMKNQND